MDLELISRDGRLKQCCYGTYELEENLLKILIDSKLRGKALSW